MPHWNTETITSDLKKLPGIKSVESQGQGGSYDTDNLIISLEGTNDNFWICGFNPDADDGIEPNDVDVEFVEVTDGLQTGCGLSSRNRKTGAAYIDIRQYFLDNGFDVVDSIKAYF